MTTAGCTFGEMDPAFNWSCGFHIRESDPACLAPAVWHGFKTFGDEIVHMTACCDPHRWIMELSVNWVHAIDSACGLPGSQFRWPENFCYLPPEQFSAVEAAHAVLVGEP